MLPWIRLLTSGILAGMMIGIGGTVYLSAENAALGASLFSVGLIYIVSFKLWLYTGRIGALAYAKDKQGYLLKLLVTLFGNWFGAYIVGFLLRHTRRMEALVSRAESACSSRLADTFPSLFLLGFFCGALLYFGILGYNTLNSDVGRHLTVFLAVVVFILCGFEHCIANMYYFTVAGVWTNPRAITATIAVILGNSAGSLVCAVLDEFRKKEE